MVVAVSGEEARCTGTTGHHDGIALAVGHDAGVTESGFLMSGRGVSVAFHLLGFDDVTPVLSVVGRGADMEVDASGAYIGTAETVVGNGHHNTVLGGGDGRDAIGNGAGGAGLENIELPLRLFERTLHCHPEIAEGNALVGTGEGHGIGLVLQPVDAHMLCFGTGLHLRTVGKREGHKARSTIDKRKVETEGSHHILSIGGLQAVARTIDETTIAGDVLARIGHVVGFCGHLYAYRVFVGAVPCRGPCAAGIGSSPFSCIGIDIKFLCRPSEDHT